MTRYLTRAFWTEAGERAVKTAAQAAIGSIGQAAAGINLFDVDAVTVLGVSGGAALLSLLTSIASARIGRVDTPSLV